MRLSSPASAAICTSATGLTAAQPCFSAWQAEQRPDGTLEGLTCCRGAGGAAPVACASLRAVHLGAVENLACSRQAGFVIMPVRSSSACVAIYRAPLQE